MTPPTAEIVSTLVRMGQLAPCVKSKRGVVIVDTRMTAVVANAFNGPPPPFTCGGDDACRADCNKICVHAEAAAISRLNEEGYEARSEYVLVHAKIVGDQMVPSGPPSCWQCSRQILHDGFAGVWLYESTPPVNRWRFYTALEFHRATLDHCGLPAVTA
jgi:deoxycytidylate deaminase